MINTKIIITQDIHEDGLNILQKNISEVVTAPSPDEETLLSLCTDEVTAFIVRHNRLTREMINKCKNLKVIVRHGVGVELIDTAAATERGIPVVNTPSAAITAVAEHTIMMMLSLAKKFFYADKTFRAGGYDFKNSYAPDDIEGKTLGIIGFGSIGREVAKRASAFDMKIIAFDAFLPEEVFTSNGVIRVNSVDEIYINSDFVSLHMPITEETKYSVNYDKFAMMKKSAHIINCSRGELIVESDLIKALNEKLIAGAGLDVFDPEPPSKDNPLFAMENVVLTPHSSALTVHGSRRMAEDSAKLLIDIFEGKELRNLVNKEILNKK